MKNWLKSEKGYIDEEVLIGGCGCAIVIIFILAFIIGGLGGFRFDLASGSHRIVPTAIDNDMWGNYKVYYRTTEYTKNSEEDYYYIDKSNTELAEQMKEYIKKRTNSNCILR